MSTIGDIADVRTGYAEITKKKTVHLVGVSE